jgi:hypothetical protein
MINMTRDRQEAVMKLKERPFYAASALIACLLLTSCMPGTRLATQDARDAEVAGTYSVILYGCNYLNDPESIVFLDKEGDKYIFEPYAPDFNYRIKKGLTAAEAFAAAEKFLDCSTGFRGTKMKRIVTPGTDTIGYEIRPLYHSFVYGLDNILVVNYWLRDGSVVVIIQLDASVERQLRESGVPKRLR